MKKFLTPVTASRLCALYVGHLPLPIYQKYIVSNQFHFYSSENSKIPLYACEAGCVREAVKLTIFPQPIPIFVTDPITPILYISHDR